MQLVLHAFGMNAVPVLNTPSPGVLTPQRTLNVLYARLILAHFLTRQTYLKDMLSPHQLAYLHQTGINARCTLREWHELMDLIQKTSRSADVIPEVVAQHGHWSTGVMGQLFLSCGSVGHSLDLMVQFQPLLDDVYIMEKGFSGKRAFLRLHQVNHECSDRLARLSLSRWMRFIKFLTNRWDLIADIHFEGECPGEAMPYRRLFGGHVRFEQGENVVFFDAAYVTLPGIHKDETLHDLLKERAIEELEVAKQGGSLFIDKIRSLIRECMDNDLQPHDIAEVLHISARTLQRRLQEAGLNLRAMIEAEKMQEAQRRLQNSDVSLSDVAFSLGYTSHSAFSRAFRRWAGVSPSGFRTHRSPPRSSV